MSYTGPIIDTDIHNVLPAHEELHPFLSSYRKAQMKSFGMPNTGHPYRSPVGVLRQDAGTPNGDRAGTDPAYLMEHHMDAMGITYGVLTGDQLGFSVLADIDLGNDLSSAFNDWLAEKWLNFSGRYLGAIAINHTDPNYAAKEIDRVAKDKRFKMIIMASGARQLFGSRFYLPIFEAAERNGLPVAFHPGAEGAGITGPPTPSGYPSLYFEWHNIITINYLAHINSLVCEGTFEKFPKLKIVALEGGISWLPHLMWRMDKNYKALRAMTPWLKRMPSEYILEHVRLSTQPVEEPPRASDLLAIFEMVQADKTVVFSSDYPHWDNDDPRYILNQLPEEMQRRIFWQNAADLFHLTEPTTKKAETNAPALSGV